MSDTATGMLGETTVARAAALVTGARRGIGRAIALALAGGGFDVAVNDLEASAELHGLCDKISGMGRDAVAVVGDISRRADHDRMLDQAEAALGPLTTLVNNAGVSVLSRGDLLDVSEESYDRCFAVNTRGTFFLTQAFARRLLARPRAPGLHHSIVSITSSNAAAVTILRSEYCMAKTAASMMSKLFAARLGNEGIGVYEIRPGIIATEMIAPSSERYDKLIAQGLTVIKRQGQPEEVARVALTLASGQLPYTNGQIIEVDGGMMSVRY